MRKFEDLLEELNRSVISQKSSDWAEDMTEEVWNGHLQDNYEIVANGLDVDTHRWYEISTTVIKIYDRLIGITHVTHIFSEAMGWDECGCPYVFTEMEEFTTISYREKNNK